MRTYYIGLLMYEYLIYKKKKATWNRNGLLWFLLTQTILLLFANSSKLGLFGFSDDGDDDDDDNSDDNDNNDSNN